MEASQVLSLQQAQPVFNTSLTSNGSERSMSSDADGILLQNWSLAPVFDETKDCQDDEQRNLRNQASRVKGPWSKEEDELLASLVAEYGAKKWSVIAEKVPGRIGKQCRERWLNHLDTSVKKTPWSEAEDALLLDTQKRLGNRWCEIARLLPGRPENSVKNRFNSLCNRGRGMMGDVRQAGVKSPPAEHATSESPKMEIDIEHTELEPKEVLVEQVRNLEDIVREKSNIDTKQNLDAEKMSHQKVLAMPAPQSSRFMVLGAAGPSPPSIRAPTSNCDVFQQPKHISISTGHRVQFDACRIRLPPKKSDFIEESEPNRNRRFEL